MRTFSGDDSFSVSEVLSRRSKRALYVTQKTTSAFSKSKIFSKINFGPINMRLAVCFKYFTFNSTAVPLHVLELFTTGKIKRNKKCHIHIIYIIT